jgi:type IV pilus assembly protein PilM
MVRLGLGQFISQKSLEGEHLVMSVPGHSAFARFAKLPPVEPKKVPDIVKFEAVQQIPFPIDEVEWDYQTFQSADSPEIEVGIFAITRERVQQRLGLYADVGLSPEAMTLSPVAVSNAMAFDLGKQTEPIIFVDIGTQATDVIISEAGRCWIRTFPLGGTHFTEAVANAFKISYSKAEKLKMEASDSKYAKQIMQAMRPVFSDLLQDLQRSIGYYQSLHRESELKNMVGVGSTFKIPGLRKFLGQQLQIDVVRLDEYKKINVKGREAASFAENAVNMATAYGLALQGVGLAPIDANLVPVKTLRDSMWRGKTKWFAAAAVVMLVGAGMMLFRPMYDQRRLEAGRSTVARNVIDRATAFKQRVDGLLAASTGVVGADDLLAMTAYRRVWPYLINDSAAALGATNPQPELTGDNLEKILQIEPSERRLVQLQKLEGTYVPPQSGANPRRILVTMDLELSHEAPIEFLNATVVQWLRENAEPSGERANYPYRIIANSITTNQEQLATIEVGEDGDTVSQATAVAAATPTPMPGFSPAAAPAARTVAKPGQGGESGSQAMRTPTAVVAPGMGFGEEGRSNSGSSTSTAAPPQPTGIPGVPGAGLPTTPVMPAGADPNAIKDLNATAPAPVKPRLYKAGSKYYRVPVTFEVELIDPLAPAVTATAGAPAAGGNAS